MLNSIRQGFPNLDQGDERCVNARRIWRGPQYRLIIHGMTKKRAYGILFQREVMY